MVFDPEELILVHYYVRSCHFCKRVTQKTIQGFQFPDNGRGVKDPFPKMNIKPPTYEINEGVV